MGIAVAGAVAAFVLLHGTRVKATETEPAQAAV